MNTDSGRIYQGEEQIRKALARGEPVVPVSERVAELVEAGERYLNRAERRRHEREERRAAKRLARRS